MSDDRSWEERALRQMARVWKPRMDNSHLAIRWAVAEIDRLRAEQEELQGERKRLTHLHNAARKWADAVRAYRFKGDVSGVELCVAILLDAVDALEYAEEEKK